MIIIGAIALCVIAHLILGMIWYSPMLFGNTWAQQTYKLSSTAKKDEINIVYGLSALAAFIMAVVLQYVMAEVEIQQISEALLLGSMLWLGFTFTTSLVNSLYQGKSKKLVFIDSGYYLLSSCSMSIIIFLLMYP